MYTAVLLQTSKDGFKRWFFEGTQVEAVGPHAKPVHTASWWKVMCLTGVDYFSTLAYQPSIAFAAAGLLSPLATLVLVLLTLFGALPMYYRVAESSPHGQGSILMLESLFPRWKGKAVVLILLGFAATSFVITITLSAADATAHFVENPLIPSWLHHPVIVTLVLLFVLGGVFMRGFSEVIGLAVVIVAIYLALNAVVIVKGITLIGAHPELLQEWRSALLARHGSPLMMLAAAMIVFPKLALGLSGFETGVAVMPLVKGDPTDTEDRPVGRTRNTKKLLLVAALIMSVLLMASSVVTTVLIPAETLVPGGAAAGRALAYLAHEHLGTMFGTIYDIATVAMLWFAGASALAGLLNLVPRYLPRYGMAPEWARANRPLIVIFILITFVVTIAFDADVEAQGGAYATGVLVLISSGAVAVAIMKWQRRHHVCTLRDDCCDFSLHDIREHGRAAGGAEDRFNLHRDNHLHVAGVARIAVDGASRTRRRGRRSRGPFHRHRRAIRGDTHHRQPARQRGPRRIRAQAERSPRLASPRTERAGPVSRGQAWRRVRVQRSPSRRRRRSRRLQDSAVPESCDSQCNRGIAAPLARHDTYDSSRGTSDGPKAIPSPTC